MWIGGSDEAVEGRWEWDSERCSFTFEDWHWGQPNNYAGAQDCLYMDLSNPQIKWNDERCTNRYYFICEFV